jgi:hypothetical protein
VRKQLKRQRIVWVRRNVEMSEGPNVYRGQVQEERKESPHAAAPDAGHQGSGSKGEIGTLER